MIKDKKYEVISGGKTLHVKVFTHNDLDGVSCAIVLKKLYDTTKISFDFTYLSYKDYQQIKDFINIDNEDGIKKYDYVFITDLNFTYSNFNDYLYTPLKRFFVELNTPHKHYSSLFKKIFLIDHHTDSEKAIRPIALDIFDKIEYFNDMHYSAAYQLMNFLVHKSSSEWTQATLGFERNKYEDIKLWVEAYAKIVHDWDTFEWKNNGNLLARDLNMVFNSMNRSKFFVMQEQKEGPGFALNKTEVGIVKDTMKAIEKEYQRALMSSVVLDHIDADDFPHPDIQYIVVRSDDHISMVCDLLIEAIRNYEIYSRFNIKYIVNLSLRNGVASLRRVYDDIDLSLIANQYGGGGHPFAAGFNLNGKDKRQLERFILPSLEKLGESIDPTKI